MDAVDRLRQIINAALTINEAHDNLEVVFQKVLSSLEFVLDCQAIAYMEYETQKSRIICRAVSSAYSQMIGLRFFKNQGSIAYKVLENKKAIMINTQAEIRHAIIDDKLYSHYKNINTILAFPLFNNTKHCFGVLEAYNKKSCTNFTKEDFYVFSLLSQQIEQSIYNASCVRILKQRINKMYDKASSSFDIIYASKEMDVKLKLAKKISQSEAPILITGEDGVGKRLLALQIHTWNVTLDGLPIIILCQDIVKTTQGNSDDLHAILFGENEKKSHNGILSQQGHKAIIFSEISMLPLKIQEAILRYLKYKSIFYGNNKIHVHNKHRIIFTSSQDLETMVSEKIFLEELYFHINALHINLPALHNRSDDVVVIAKHYFQKYIRKFQRNIKHVDSDVFVLLQKYGWPYSVRELIHVIYRSVLYCNGNTITCRDIVFHSAFEFTDVHTDVVKYTKTLKEAVDSFKRKYIYNALISNNWNCTNTARKLQIQRSYLSRLIKNLNLKNIRNTGVVS